MCHTAQKVAHLAATALYPVVLNDVGRSLPTVRLSTVEFFALLKGQVIFNERFKLLRIYRGDVDEVDTIYLS